MPEMRETVTKAVPSKDWEKPTRNDKPWNFCGKCGSGMRWIMRGPGYDRETGGPVRIWVWSCSRWMESDTKHDRQEGTVHQRITGV